MEKDFLKNLKDSLEKGEKNEEIVDHLKEIDEKADQLIDGSAYTKMDDRLESSGVKQELDEDERKKAEAEYVEVINKQKLNDEMLQQLAIIEQQNVRIKELKFEFEQVKDKFSKDVAKIYDYKITLLAEFEKKYGKKAEDEYSFGDEPNKELT